MTKSKFLLLNRIDSSDLRSNNGKTLFQQLQDNGFDSKSLIFFFFNAFSLIA